MIKKDPRKGYTGVLAKPMEPVHVSLLTTEEDKERKFKKQATENMMKMFLLLKHHSIDFHSPDPWYLLALALAKEFVPGFQDEVKRGAPKKWGIVQLGILHAEIDALVEESDTTIEGAAKRLAAMDPWSAFLSEKAGTHFGPDPAEALRRAYHLEFSDNNSKLFKMARMYHIHVGDMDGWHRFVTECICADIK